MTTDIPMTNTLLRVRLPSGNDSVYSVQPQHMAGTEDDLNNRAIMYGIQFAVCFGGVWHQNRTVIDDKRTIELINTLPKAW